MGADLICYICKGPRKLSKQRRQRAARAISPLLAALAEIKKQSDTGIATEDLDQKLVENVLHAYGAAHGQLCAAKRSTTILVGDIDERDYLVRELFSVQSALTSIDFARPDDVVTKFADFWQDGQARDLSQRDDPDDPRQQIVVAGELSWGDEPDGYGYQMLKMANLYLLLEHFNIR